MSLSLLFLISMTKFLYEDVKKIVFLCIIFSALVPHYCTHCGSAVLQAWGRRDKAGASPHDGKGWKVTKPGCWALLSRSFMGSVGRHPCCLRRDGVVSFIPTPHSDAFTTKKKKSFYAFIVQLAMLRVRIQEMLLKLKLKLQHAYFLTERWRWLKFK